MISERIAPGMLPRVLNTTDMTIVFLAIVPFVVQASVIQPAGPSAYVYWILGFLLFLIPGAIVTAQLGRMFPQEGSLVVMLAYLWATFGNMVTVPLGENNSTTGILTAVQTGFWGSHAFAIVVALVVMWFFVSSTVVYDYSFSRPLFVSGLERRMRPALGRVNERTTVPVNAILLQAVIASIFTIVTFGPWAQNGNFPWQVHLTFQAAVTVIWCLSMVLLFADVFLVRRAYPERFEEVRVASTPVLLLSGVVGAARRSSGPS
jgi:amino acid transporter